MPLFCGKWTKTHQHSNEDAPSPTVVTSVTTESVSCCHLSLPLSCGTSRLLFPMTIPLCKNHMLIPEVPFTLYFIFLVSLTERHQCFFLIKILIDPLPFPLYNLMSWLFSLASLAFKSHYSNHHCKHINTLLSWLFLYLVSSNSWSNTQIFFLYSYAWSTINVDKIIQTCLLISL